MGYTPTVWQEGVTTLGPTNMNHLEGGVASAASVADAAIPLTQKGAPGGVAALDGAGKVPAAQLPASAGPGIPAGGTLGQALKKTSAADYAAAWQDSLPTDSVVAAATRVISNLLAAGDTQPAWRVMGDGRMDWGAGGSTAVDTSLYRQGVNTLRTDSNFWTGSVALLGTANLSGSGYSAVGNTFLSSKLSADTQTRLVVQADGTIRWGDGTNPQDLMLLRYGPGIFGVGTAAQKGRLHIFGGAVTDTVVDAQVTTDAFLRWLVRADGQMQWGPGNAAQDVTLSRGSAGVLWLGTQSQKGRLLIFGSVAGDMTLASQAAADTVARYSLFANGNMQWGDGTAAQDTTLYRIAANELSLGSSSQPGMFRLNAATTNAIILRSFITGDAQPRLTVRSEGALQWSDGTAVQDTTLARGAAGRLEIGTTSQGGRLYIRPAGAANITLLSQVGAEANARWYMDGGGTQQWGDGTAAQDVTLARQGAGRLDLGTPTQRGYFRIFADVAGSGIVHGRVTADAFDRWVVRGDGSQVWGDGTAAQDTTLARIGAGILRLGTPSPVQKGRLVIVGSAVTDTCVDTWVGADTASRWVARADGRLIWGDGTVQDTVLYRSAADRLKTDDLFDATGLALATKVKAGTPVDADWTAAPPDGTLVGDSSASKLWIRLGGTWVAPAGGAGTSQPVALVQDQKAQNTAGGTSGGAAWTTRVLNTKVSDPGSIVTIASNQFTLQAGTYFVRARCPAYNCGRHQARLQNITDGTTTQYGASVFAQNTAVETDSVVEALFVISAQKTFEIQHWTALSVATQGFGVETNAGTEVYTSIEIRKVA